MVLLTLVYDSLAARALVVPLSDWPCVANPMNALIFILLDRIMDFVVAHVILHGKSRAIA
jgi:hypothetical protein